MGIAERYFLTVAETGSFTKAAEKLFVSQPAVSKQIQQLEEELGLVLFLRTTRSVKLTPQGRILYNVLVESSQAWNQALEAAKQACSEEEVKPLNIGLLSGWGIHRPPISSIGMIQKLYPNIPITIQQHSYRAMTKRLYNGKLDLILTTTEELEPHISEFGWTLALQTELILYMSSCNPAARLEDPAAAFTEPAYVMDQDSSIFSQRAIERLVQQRGWNMPIVPVPNIDSIYAAVDSGKGCAFTCLNSRVCDSAEYKVFHYDIPMELVFAWRLDRYNASINLFLNEFKRLSNESPS